MGVVSLKNMDVDELLSLREQIDETLDERATELQKQLARLGGGVKRGRPVGSGRASVLKGVKGPPRYRGPNGETWVGRGARPKWLVALLAEGHSLVEFGVDGNDSDGAAFETEDEAPAKLRRGTARKKGRRKRG